MVLSVGFKMKTVILCGGKGTRLREETEFKPKPLVTVGPHPIIWHIMKIYSHYGHNEFILPLGYKGDSLKEYFVNFNWRNNDFTLGLKNKDISLHNFHGIDDWKVSFVDTGLETLTGLRLYKVKHLLKDEENFFLTYGDGLADINISALLKFHLEKGKIATITGINMNSRYGILDVNHEEGLITNFSEKPKGEEYINGGFMVFNKRIFDFLTSEDIMFENDLLPKLARMKELAIFKHHGFWQCMDTHRDYLHLNKIWEEDKPWKVWQ